jgi:glutamine synthetase type III
VFVEQYATRVGIKGATAAQIARTLLVSAAADRLEHLVADELWPLPRYAEMLHQR